MKTFILIFSLLISKLLWAQTSFNPPQDLYQPTQYAFIADAGLPSVAVVDLQAGKQIDLLQLAVTPRVFSSSTDQPYLAYSDKDNWAMYLFNLTTRETKKIKTPAAVYQIMFVPFSSKIAVVLEEQVGIYDHQSGELTILDKKFQNLYTRFEAVFSIFSQTFWVMQENSPLIHQYRFSDKNPRWETIDIGYEHGLGSGAPSFEDKYIAINSYYPDQSFIYHLSTGKVTKTGPLYDSRKLNQRLVKPYIDSATRHILFADLSGEVIVYDMWTNSKPKRINVGFPVTSVKTGWLDRYAIIGGHNHLSIRPINSLADDVTFSFPDKHDVWDIWVSGDSKLVLATTALSPKLIRYDLQKKERLPDITLKGLAQAKFIRMGSSNDACY